MISERENLLRAIEFRYPEWIPCSVVLSPATWRKHREKLEALVSRHPLVFRESDITTPSLLHGYRKGSMGFDEFPPVYREREYFRDNWGCLWYNAHGGILGRIVEHPLADWKELDTYQPPDYLSKTEWAERDWGQVKIDIEERRRKGLLTIGEAERLLDRMYFLRGFKNLMIDFATDDPHLQRLIDMLLDHEMKLTRKWLEVEVDIIKFHTDMATQNGLMISPTKFRKYLKPMFKELFSTCRNAGTHVYLSSDGRVLDIVDDLIECGVSVHDPQLRANTLEGIEKAYKGKMCVIADLDRQMFPFCKPEEMRKHVKDVVERLYLPEGGLMVLGSIWGEDVPLENIEALCQAMEEFCINAFI